MKDKNYILLLLVIIGLAGFLVYLLSKKPKQNTTEDKATKDTQQQPPQNTTHTNISMTAEGKPFSTLFGISQILNSLNPLMQSIPGIFNSVRNQNQQGTQQNFNKELFCQAQPFNPICN